MLNLPLRLPGPKEATSGIISLASCTLTKSPSVYQHGQHLPSAADQIFPTSSFTRSSTSLQSATRYHCW